MYQSGFRNFLSYYKWHLIFALVVIICLSFMFGKFLFKEEPDLRIGYTSTEHMNTQTFSDSKSEIELLIRDANKDDEKLATIEAFADSDMSKVTTILEQYIKSNKYDIYIANKKAFTSIKDKSVFADSNRYFISHNSMLNTLEDEDGRIYAISLKDNSLVKYFGMSQNEDLYIAAAKDLKGEESIPRKNGMNISGYIIENRNKYNTN